jgi:hypothetical protein
MSSATPLADALDALGDATVAPETTTLAMPRRSIVADPDAARFTVLAGMYDLLADEETGSTDPATAVRRLEEALHAVRSIEPTFRFAAYERSALTESRELRARVHGREVALTESWMVPRLEGEIERYRERIRQLVRVIGDLG